MHAVVDTDSMRRRQAELVALAREAPLPVPRFVAGADCAFPSGTGRVVAVALVWDRAADQVVDVADATAPADVPYVPGFLSFREGPAIRAALAKLTHPWSAILFDGQGRAHPRRCGLATHLGVELDVPSVGAAKSLLVGTHGDLAEARGSTADLTHKGERVGRALRTRDKVKPMYVSVGHRAALADACALVLACCTRYRMPEPTRRADALVALAAKRLKG